MAIEKTLHVSVRSGYDVLIGRDCLSDIGETLKVMFPGRHAHVVTDSNVEKLYLQTLNSSLERSGIPHSYFTFPAGEENKTLSTYGDILLSIAENGLTRSDYIIALGGGVCGDMAGFAAGTYMRGIPFVQIPTTVLSMVDSSVGGKCAVDLPSGKNLEGVFHQPSLVMCDISTLNSLPKEVFSEGMAEAVKTGILCGEPLFSLCCDPSDGNMLEIISRCISYKAGVVERDETEQGERKLLNLGHTAGHAIERCSGFSVPHGHAVAIGTAIMARAAERMGLCREPISDRVENSLKNNRLPVFTDFTPEELVQAARMDKKSKGDAISVIIPEAVGSCTIKTICFDDLLAFFKLGLQ